MAIPFLLCMCSNLCGPNFIELWYSTEIKSEDKSGSEDSCHHGCHDMEGAVAIIHEDIRASCEFGASGVGFICLTAIFPFFLMAQAYFMNRTTKKLEAEFENDNKAVDEVLSLVPVVGSDGIQVTKVTSEENHKCG
jgi:hypothetical protein